LSVKYGEAVALNGISFHVNTGEIVAMIGPNGAGKSSTLKAVCGSLNFTNGHIETGEILFDGQDITSKRTDELVSLGISTVHEGRRIFPSMTVLENLELGGFIEDNTSMLNNAITSILDLFPLLNERIHQKAGTLSGGEQQLLTLGRALILKPKLLLIDEPSIGLSPNYLDIVFDTLKEINKKGISILIIEQNTKRALEICDRVYIFSMGSIVREGSKSLLLQDDQIKKIFLGCESR
jgi:branched-chain amino acid transport system ATP-binding protein